MGPGAGRLGSSGHRGTSWGSGSCGHRAGAEEPGVDSGWRVMSKHMSSPVSQREAEARARQLEVSSLGQEAGPMSPRLVVVPSLSTWNRCPGLCPQSHTALVAKTSPTLQGGIVATGPTFHPQDWATSGGSTVARAPLAWPGVRGAASGSRGLCMSVQDSPPPGLQG